MSLNKEEKDNLKRKSSIASITMATSLSLLKIFASIYSGSLSVLSSTIDSVADVFASLITFIAIRFSSRPATESFRYGYGKAESISGLFQAAFIAGSGFFVLYDGINRFFNPRPIDQTSLALTVMIISLISTIALIIFQSYVVKKTDSIAIKADRAHYTVDVLTNSSIILTLLAVKFFGWVWFDTLTAVVISSFLLYNSFSLAEKAIQNLLDKELDDTIRKKVKKLVLSHPQIQGIHDLRTRDIGGIYTFEFHLELDSKLTLDKAHDLAHEVEDILLKKYPNTQIIIHQEPAGINDEKLDNKIKRAKKRATN